MVSSHSKHKQLCNMPIIVFHCVTTYVQSHQTLPPVFAPEGFGNEIMIQPSRTSFFNALLLLSDKSVLWRIPLMLGTVWVVLSSSSLSDHLMNDTCILKSGVPAPPPRKEGLASLVHRFVQGLSVMIHRAHQSDCRRCVKDEHSAYLCIRKVGFSDSSVWKTGLSNKARQTCLSHAGIREPNLSHDYASGEALA